MHGLRVAVATLVTLTLAAYAAAAGPQQVSGQTSPAIDQVLPRSQPGPPRTGTGRIRGRVIADDSGSPVRRAQVRLSGIDGPSRLVTTDANGSYEFAGLPEGRFNLSATKVGYVSVQYGQTRPFEVGRPLELAARQVVDRADIVMPRGSAIVGRIVDEFGEPLAEATVSASRQQWAGGRRRLLNAGVQAQTNDLGQYRLYGLPPGDYYVSSSVRNSNAMMIDMTAGAMAGAVGLPDVPPTGYAPTYFPGSASPAEAQKVTIPVGQESHGIDFQLVPIRMGRVRGVVVNSEGHPVGGAMVMAYPSRGLEGAAMMFNAGTTREGTFTLSSLPPGEYTLQARSIEVATTTAGGTTAMRMTPDSAETGVISISVAGDEPNSVVITTSRGATVTGRMIFEGERPRTTTGVRVTAPAVDELASQVSPSPGTVKVDDSFELNNLAGVRQFRVAGLPAGWAVKSVTLNGSDITDSGVQFTGADAVSGVQIVVSSRSTTVSGAVMGADGKPAKDYTVVIFSDDPQKWRAAWPRWINGTRPAQDGRFRVQTMPPGGYYAIAVEYLPLGDWYDPEVLERLKARAQRFSLGEGETRTLDLKISGGA